MAKKSVTYWNPSAKGHLGAAHMLSKAAPHLSKSAPVVQRKLASFRAAAKAASRASSSVPPIKKPPPFQPSKLQQPPAGDKPLGTKPATPLKTGLPPKMPGG